jgi:hypothetical protein
MVQWPSGPPASVCAALPPDGGANALHPAASPRIVVCNTLAAAAAAAAVARGGRSGGFQGT